MSFRFEVTGNAFPAFQRALREGRVAVMRAVNEAAHRVQAKAKVNVHQKLNTTGLSKGFLSRSITVLSHPGRLEAEIGPSAIYGRIHELGGTIKPVKSDYLWFKVPASQALVRKRGGGFKGGDMAYTWVRTKEVTIPPRPYLEPALEATKPEIEAIFTNEIHALFGGG